MVHPSRKYHNFNNLCQYQFNHFYDTVSENLEIYLFTLNMIQKNSRDGLDKKLQGQVSEVMGALQTRVPENSTLSLLERFKELTIRTNEEDHTKEQNSTKIPTPAPIPPYHTVGLAYALP